MPCPGENEVMDDDYIERIVTKVSSLIGDDAKFHKNGLDKEVRFELCLLP